MSALAVSIAWQNIRRNSDLGALAKLVLVALGDQGFVAGVTAEDVASIVAVDAAIVRPALAELHERGLL